MTKERFALSRRNFLKTSGFGLAGLAGLIGLRYGQQSAPHAASAPHQTEHEMGHGMAGTVGTVDHAANGFDPHEILYDWDLGTVTEENGRAVRTWRMIATDKEIEIAPGLYFPAWVYGSATTIESQRSDGVVGRCPGPTLRCIEGEQIRIEFINASSHPHTIHFHGIHSAYMDGIAGVGRGMIQPGESFTYEFGAEPFGCHLYHCHAVPLKRHIHKGLYGAFIIDPDPERHSGEEGEIAKTRNHTYPENQSVNEMVMIMNGFDTNFDGDNEVYAVNSIAFAYMNQPIPIQRDQRQRIYLINITEFDPINSFHLHANFFDYYDHGTTLKPTLKTVDTIMQCQAQRGILEFTFEGFEPGQYMFHAHQSEFAELGWMGFFEVQ